MMNFIPGVRRWLGEKGNTEKKRTARGSSQIRPLRPAFREKDGKVKNRNHQGEEFGA